MKRIWRSTDESARRAPAKPTRGRIGPQEETADRPIRLPRVRSLDPAAIDPKEPGGEARGSGLFRKWGCIQFGIGMRFSKNWRSLVLNRPYGRNNWRAELASTPKLPIVISMAAAPKPNIGLFYGIEEADSTVTKGHFNCDCVFGVPFCIAKLVAFEKGVKWVL